MVNGMDGIPGPPDGERARRAHGAVGGAPGIPAGSAGPRSGRPRPWTSWAVDAGTGRTAGGPPDPVRPDFRAGGTRRAAEGRAAP